MQHPKVSILFPVYNTAAYLQEAVDSMLSQTFKDFELIVLDDCSPDNASEILDSYTDSRMVRYRGEKNVGLANVLNIGMDMARGEYIARMDSDDISLPERLQFQVDYLDSHPKIDLVSVGMQQFGRQNRTLSYDNTTEEIKFTALFYSPILHASSMWRREKFVDLRFDQTKVPSEDYDMWTRALLKGVQMRNLPNVLYRYRMHSAQVNLNPSEKEWNEVRFEYLKSICPRLSADEIYKLSDDLLNGYDGNVTLLNSALHIIAEQNDFSCFFVKSNLKRNTNMLIQTVAYKQISTNGFVIKFVPYLGLRKLIKVLFSFLRNPSK